MAKFHNSKEATATLALVKVLEPQYYGVPILENDKIIQFLEKPRVPPSSFINSGLYLFDSSIHKYDENNNEFLMSEQYLFPKLASEGKLFGYKFIDSKWYDCGTFERWEKAINELGNNNL